VYTFTMCNLSSSTYLLILLLFFFFSFEIYLHYFLVFCQYYIQVELFSSVRKAMKGYKITNCAQNKKIGIAGSSFEEVFIKGCQKLKVNIYFISCF